MVELIKCNTCTKLVKDDGEFICSPCMKNWKKAIIGVDREILLKNIRAIFDKHYKTIGGKSMFVHEEIKQLFEWGK